MGEPRPKPLLMMTREELERLEEQEQAKRAAAVPRIRTTEELRAMSHREATQYLGELAVANLREAQRRAQAEELEQATKASASNSQGTFRRLPIEELMRMSFGQLADYLAEEEAQKAARQQ